MVYQCIEYKTNILCYTKKTFKISEKSKLIFLSHLYFQCLSRPSRHQAVSRPLRLPGHPFLAQERQRGILSSQRHPRSRSPRTEGLQPNQTAVHQAQKHFDGLAEEEVSRKFQDPIPSSECDEENHSNHNRATKLWNDQPVSSPASRCRFMVSHLHITVQ